METTESIRWTPRVVAIAVACVAMVGIALGALAARGDDEPVEPAPPTQADGAVTSSAGCVEAYDLTTLANRELAFAGTLRSVDGDEAAFEVERWFRGGEAGEVTLRGAALFGGATSVDAPALAEGDRALVAGDDGFAWACGFTQPYDATVADDWARVFAEG